MCEDCVRSRAMEKFLQQVRDGTEDHDLALQGFRKAFIAATGIKPEEAMLVQSAMQEGDQIVVVSYFVKRPVHA